MPEIFFLWAFYLFVVLWNLQRDHIKNKPRHSCLALYIKCQVSHANYKHLKSKFWGILCIYQITDSRDQGDMIHTLIRNQKRFLIWFLILAEVPEMPKKSLSLGISIGREKWSTYPSWQRNDTDRTCCITVKRTSLTLTWQHQWGSLYGSWWIQAKSIFCKWRWQTTSALTGDETQREGVRGQRMKWQHLCSHLTGWKKSGRRGWRGVWERVGVALEARMEDTSLPAAAVRGKGTQGLLFPLRSLSPRRSLVFPQQTVGTMKAACSPPLAQRAVNTGPIRPWMAESAFPWKSSQWPASPGSPPCEVGDSYNFNK